MFRFALVVVAFALMQAGSIQYATAQDNPVIRSLVRDVIKKELSSHDSKERGWRQGNTWLWLDDPSANLAADITYLTLEDGRLTIEGRATAVIAFHHQVATLMGHKTIVGQARVYLSFRAVSLVGERSNRSAVNIGRLEIHELRLRGDAVRPFQGIIQDGVNMLLKNKKRDIEKRLEEALNNVGRN